MANCTTIEQVKELLRQENEGNNQAGDATWILTSSFLIFTMQSGFGLLEAGSCSSKCETNIMVKNVVDVLFGSLGYWVCGFALSFGQDESSNGFTGVGYFFTDINSAQFGSLYAKYVFQLSFATTATTIVSGAMAERTNLTAYMFFSFINMISYIFPAHWIWDNRGFLYQMGVVDIAGCGPVHIVGGISGLIATCLLKPRKGIFSKHSKHVMASPTNLVLGTFMLWWGWLGFNCGSTFGVSGGKWKFASRSAVTTINASVGGGIWAVLYSYKLTKRYKGKLDVASFTSGILGGLVSVTAICAICRPWEALLIGFIGGIITSYGTNLMIYLKIDDPVAAVPVHFFCGIWGLLVVGICGEQYENIGYNGLTKGGPAIFLAKQLLAVVCVSAWAAVTCILQLLLTDKLIGLRMNPEDEKIGADIVEHGLPAPRGFRTSIYGRRRYAVGSRIEERNIDEDYLDIELTSAQDKLS